MNSHDLFILVDDVVTPRVIVSLVMFSWRGQNYRR